MPPPPSPPPIAETIQQKAKPRDGSDTFRVLLTGFGPFRSHPVANPAWICVCTLSDAIIPALNSDYNIHITTFQIPTRYQSILDIVPLLHARPPIIPDECNSSLPPPDQGYDFIMHVGAGRPGVICLEYRGHKTGYGSPDAFGELPPLTSGIGSEIDDEDIRGSGPSPAIANSPPGPVNRRRLGFPKGYEEAPLEVTNDRLDLKGLERHLHGQGFKPLHVSDDAGLYCCDYLAYCSMYQSQETTRISGDGSPVLFMHIPPFGEVYSQERVIDCITGAVQWACSNQR